MRIHLSDPTLLPDLLDFLGTRKDCVLAQISADAVAVSLLGSYRADSARAAVERLLGEWRAAHPSTRALLLVDADGDGRPGAALE